jgi:Ca2+/H+ antiporter, TMEM165/GDT1 family
LQVSELGDKTFLIAAILAMRQSRLTIFLGAFAALALMSVLSAFLGVVFPTLLPKALTTLLASILFFLFGAKMLQEGLKMDGNEMDEEWQQATKEIEGQEDDAHEMERLEEALAEEDEEPNGIARPNLNRRSSNTPERNGHAAPRRASVSSKPRGGIKEGAKNLLSLCFSPVFAQAFVLTFLGEWGDRSQIATIALAAAHVSTCVLQSQTAS